MVVGLDSDHRQGPTTNRAGPNKCRVGPGCRRVPTVRFRADGSGGARRTVFRNPLFIMLMHAQPPIFLQLLSSASDIRRPPVFQPPSSSGIPPCYSVTLRLLWHPVVPPYSSDIILHSCSLPPSVVLHSCGLPPSIVPCRAIALLHLLWHRRPASRPAPSSHSPTLAGPALASPYACNLLPYSVPLTCVVPLTATTVVTSRPMSCP